MAVLFVTVSGASVSAQRLPTCRERAGSPALGFGVTGLATDLSFGQSLTGGMPFVDGIDTRAPGLSIDGALPLGGTWSVRGFVGLARFGVERITYAGASSEEPGHRIVGNIPFQRIQVGVVRSSADGRRFCGYGGFTGGVLRASYKGATTRPFSASGLLGFEVPMGTAGQNALALEFQLDVALTRNDSPFKYADALGAAFVFRHRF